MAAFGLPSWVAGPAFIESDNATFRSQPKPTFNFEADIWTAQALISLASIFVRKLTLREEEAARL